MVFKFLLIGLAVFSVSGCGVARQMQYKSALGDCDKQYGFDKNSYKQWGEYDIPAGWEPWLICKQEAMLQNASGTWEYPFVLELVAGEKEIIQEFKAKRINRPQMNIISARLQANILQKQQQQQRQMQAAQAPRSQEMMQMGLKLMQGPAEPVRTDCTDTFTGWSCTTQ